MAADSSSDQRPVIPASEILAKIERGEDVKYDGVIIEGDLDVSGLELPTETEYEKLNGWPENRKLVNSIITITNSEIKGNVNFSESHLKNIANFTRTEFTGEYANFGGTKFRVIADFCEAKLDGKVNFWGAEFGSDAYFVRVELCGDADFWGVVFGRNVNFRQARFGGNANFREAIFVGEAGFEEAEFNENAFFVGAEFTGRYAGFWRTRFLGGDAVFDYDQFQHGLSFKDATFSKPTSKEVACRIAKRKMEQQGDKQRADYYFYREMEAIRLKKGIRGIERISWPWKMQVSEWLKLFGSKIWRFGWYDIFEYVLIQCIFGYGVHPLRLFGFWILMAGAFASFYWYFDAVEGARTSIDYIWFSIATSATPGYALYNPVGNYKIVTGIQAIIGTFMWAAFIATFARKWQR